MPTSRGSSPPRDTMLISCVSCTAGGFFMAEPPGKCFLKLCSILYCEYTIIQHLKLTSSAMITSLAHIYVFIFASVFFRQIFESRMQAPQIKCVCSFQQVLPNQLNLRVFALPQPHQKKYAVKILGVSNLIVDKYFNEFQLQFFIMRRLNSFLIMKAF